MYRTPHALHSVFGPRGPVRHCGVFSDAQWVHLRTPPSTPADASLAADTAFFLLLLLLLTPPVLMWAGVGKSDEDEDDVDDDDEDWFGATRVGDARLVDAARERLLLAPRPGAAAEAVGSTRICAAAGR